MKRKYKKPLYSMIDLITVSADDLKDLKLCQREVRGMRDRLELIEDILGLRDDGVGAPDKVG